MTVKKLRKETFVRMNMRVTNEHSKFIKAMAKKLKISEGAAVRAIISRQIQENG